MEFPLSGVEISPLVPVLVGFVLATATTPAGVSGAFLLLPFQVGVLGFTGPGVTPTNLLYNVISTPGGISRFGRDGALDRRLVTAISSGAVPGVIFGALLRVTVFASVSSFKAVMGLVLIGLGANLIVQARQRAETDPGEGAAYDARWVRLLGAAAGTVGGIYGISGGSIIAPVLAGGFGLPVKRVAPAALVATLITSVAGVCSFLLLPRLIGAEVDARPDWLLALLFGLGGAAGGYTGARFGLKAKDMSLRALLGAIALVLGVLYVAPTVA